MGHTAASLYHSEIVQTCLIFLSCCHLLRYWGPSCGIPNFSLNHWVPTATAVIVVHLCPCDGMTVSYICNWERCYNFMVENMQRILQYMQKVTMDWEQGTCKCSFIWKTHLLYF